MEENIICEFVEIYKEAVKNNQTAAGLGVCYNSLSKSFYYNDIQITKNSIADKYGDDFLEEVLAWVKK